MFKNLIISTHSVAASYKPSMLVTRVRLPGAHRFATIVLVSQFHRFGMRDVGAQQPHWGLNPGPSVYKTDALPLSYRG